VRNQSKVNHRVVRCTRLQGRQRFVSLGCRVPTGKQSPADDHWSRCVAHNFASSWGVRWAREGQVLATTQFQHELLVTSSCVMPPSPPWMVRLNPRVDAQGRRDDGLERTGKQRGMRVRSMPRGRSPPPPGAVATPARTSVLAAEAVSDLGPPFQELGAPVTCLEPTPSWASLPPLLLCMPWEIYGARRARLASAGAGPTWRDPTSRTGASEGGGCGDWAG